MIETYQYFTPEELECSCGLCVPRPMDHQFMLRIMALRIACGFPLPVSSAHRCPIHNNNVSSTGFNGPHTTAKAIDLEVSGEKTHILLGHAVPMGFTGIGISQKGPHGSRFIHLDDIVGHSRPRVWSY